MELIVTYDMRAPAFGASARELYAAALDQVQWADEVGFDTVGLGEHHASPDGYNPSPLPLAAAMAARSKRITLRPSVLLAPFYDPIKLAEDTAVLQIASGGRLELGIGGGYRPAEFEMYDRKLSDRWRTVGETVDVLRTAWRGEPFDWHGHRCTVTPQPDPPPAIILGGSTAKAARRAARIADGWLPPLDPRLWQPYRDECTALGKEDPGPYPKQGPIFLWVSDQPDRDWEWLMPHILHQLKSYAEWTAESFGKPAGPYAAAVTPETIRSSDAYRVLTPEQTVDLAERLGERSVLYLSPLLAGIAPERASRMIGLFERRVRPYLPGK